MQANQIELTDLRTIEQLAAEHPDVLTVTAIRWQLRHRHENGLGAACVKVGKRVLISKSRYQQWLADCAASEV